MKDLSVQDWCAIIGAVAVVGGFIWGLVKFVFRKTKVEKADMRANFFKEGKHWNLRIYNQSVSDIEASDIRVLVPDTDGLIMQWNEIDDSIPSLKRHGKFDIHCVLCTSAPHTVPITIKWKQGQKEFETAETIQLK